MVSERSAAEGGRRRKVNGEGGGENRGYCEGERRRRKGNGEGRKVREQRTCAREEEPDT